LSNKLFFIKRIDNLGRIVIPKSIRNDLLIKTEDFLKISKYNNAILIEKHEQLLNTRKLYTLYMKLLELNTNLECVLTNREQCLYSTILVCNNMPNLDEGYKKLINDLKKISGKGALKITEELSVNAYYGIFPIFIGGSLVGSIIIYNEKPILEKHEKVTELITRFFDE